MEEESFIGAYMDMPEDLSGNDSRLYVFRVGDFCEWCRRVRDAHEREVDGGVADAMTDAELADHGLCRIGSEVEDNERFRREAGPFCDRLREAAENREDVTLFGVDYVTLPLDADGEPIHVGDVMEWCDSGESKPLVVDRMELSHGRDGDLWCVALDTDKECWNQPSLMRHYTPPTVEDVLREFADEMNQNLGMYTGEVIDADDWRDADAKTVEKYAAKLRLAEEVE